MCMIANVEVAPVLGSNPASSGTVEPVGRQMKQCRIKYIKKLKKFALFKLQHRIFRMFFLKIVLNRLPASYVQKWDW
jgi:hypothetical protein